jgi:tRNA pseudouridine55 synthase
MAQRGEVFEMPTRNVQIHEAKVAAYAYPDLKLRVVCGAGTYIRSLAHDLGQSMHCGGYLAGLRRTKVGEWSVDDAAAPDAAAWTDVLPLKEVLKGFPSIKLSAEHWDDIRNGRVIPGTIGKEPLIAWFDGLPVAILETNPKAEGTLKPRKVLA